jgi:hypothetical protein
LGGEASLVDALVARGRARAWTLLFWLTALAASTPLVAVRHPPFTDLPEHVAAIATLARLLGGGGDAPYEVALGQSQYFLYHLIGAVMTRLVGDAVTAHRALLGVVALLWPLSLRALLRALGRDERIAVFGAMLVYNRALLIGFLPFVASVPLAVFGLVLLVRQLTAPRVGRAALLSALATASFFTHVSSFLLFVACAGGLAVAHGVKERSLATSLKSLLPLVPSLAALAMWWQKTTLVDPDYQEQVRRIPIEASLAAMPLWTFDLWQSHVDEICAVIWWTSFGTILASSLRRDVTTAGAFALVPFACAAILFVATPHYVGMTGFLGLRLAPVVVLFALLGLARVETRLGSIALLAGSIAGIITAVNAGFEMRRIEREHVGDLDALLSHAAPGSRLATLNFETTSRRTPLWPYVFAGSYHRARAGGVASYSFTEMAHWPIHYRQGSAPPRRRPFWIYTPCVYRYRADGEYYDYVLVQGRRDPFAEPVPGPTFVPVARSRTLTLYAKTDGPSDDVSPDRGPCPDDATTGSLRQAE